MIAPELLAILVCPKTHQPLHEASSEQLATAISLQASGKLQNVAGENVETIPHGLLIREDGQIGYLVVDDIPVMLIEEGIPLAQLT